MGGQEGFTSRSVYFLLRLRGEIRGQGRNSGFRERHSLIGLRRRCREIWKITIYTNTQWGWGNTTLARTRAVRSRRRIRIISLDILPPSFRDETEDVGELTYGYSLFLIVAPASGTSACPFCGGEVCIALCGPKLVSMRVVISSLIYSTFSQSSLSNDQICVHGQVYLQAAHCCTHRELGPLCWAERSS